MGLHKEITFISLTGTVALPLIILDEGILGAFLALEVRGKGVELKNSSEG